MHSFVSAKEWMVGVGLRIAVLSSISVACSLVPSAAFAEAQPSPLGRSSLQLTVFETLGRTPETGAFILVPNRVGEIERSNRSQPATDPVVQSMLASFSVPQVSSPTGGAEITTFSARPSASFVVVPRWMRTGVRPGTAPLSMPLAIGSCGARSYRPSNLLRPTAESRRRALFPLVQQAACEAGLPVSLMDAMLIQESGYNPWALSSKGAFGLGQLMPGTARYLGVDRYDIRGNLNGAARYLREHLTEFGDASLALAAYNAGPGRVRRSRGVPNITETKDYVRSILKNWWVLENNESTNSWQKY